MTMTTITDTTRIGATGSGSATTTTRSLLACAVATAPVFVVVSLAQAFTRQGFDLTRHPLSVLSNGGFAVASRAAGLVLAAGDGWAMTGGRAGSLTLCVGVLTAMIWVSVVAAWLRAKTASAHRISTS
jgi:hypothetical protein